MLIINDTYRVEDEWEAQRLFRYKEVKGTLRGANVFSIFKLPSFKKQPIIPRGMRTKPLYGGTLYEFCISTLKPIPKDVYPIKRVSMPVDGDVFHIECPNDIHNIELVSENLNQDDVFYRFSCCTCKLEDNYG